MAKKPVAAKKTVKKTVTKKDKPAAKPAAKKVTAKKAVPAKAAAKKATPAKAVKKAPKKSVAASTNKKEAAVKKAEPINLEPSKIVIPKAHFPAKKVHTESPRVEVNEPEKPHGKPTAVRYSDADLAHFKQLIIDRQSEILEQLQNLRDQVLDPTTGEYINENSPYSLHMAEQGSDAMEREKIYLYAQRENKFLGYLEEALKRIETGTYGLCIECIDDPKLLCPTCPLIPKPRLTAVPHSQLCVEIKNRQEKNRR